MKKLIASILAAVGLTLGVVLASPAPAQAVSVTSVRQFGCAMIGRPYLHATFTRTRFSNGTSHIYASATASYKQVIPLAPDINWRFYRFRSTGLQTRYYQPTTWTRNFAGAPLNQTYRLVIAEWIGTDTYGERRVRSCSEMVY